MPYVEVWVDEEECAGKCATAKEQTARATALERAAQVALDFLAFGEGERAASVLQDMLDGREASAAIAEEAALRALFGEWQSLPPNRPPFFEWAHQRRIPKLLSQRSR